MELKNNWVKVWIQLLFEIGFSVNVPGNYGVIIKLLFTLHPNQYFMNELNILKWIVILFPTFQQNRRVDIHGICEDGEQLDDILTKAVNGARISYHLTYLLQLEGVCYNICLYYNYV